MDTYANESTVSIIVSQPLGSAVLALAGDGRVSVAVPTGYKNPLCLRCAERVRDCIDATGLFRQEVAALGGLTHVAVGHIEDGRRMPRLSTIERISDALGLPPTWLAYGDEGFSRFRRRTPRSPVPFDPPMPTPARREHREQWRAVCRRLAAARTGLALSLRELADAAGVSAQTVLLIEKGNSDPSISTVERLAVALDVAPGWLAFGEGEEPTLTSESAAGPPRTTGAQ